MIYVFGRFGYLGRNLIPFLENKGWDVYGIGRKDKWPKFRPEDTVINCACAGWMPWDEPDKWDMWESNAVLPGRIAKELNGANMIHMGASVEWLKPDIPYSWTKAQASETLLKMKCAHVCYVYTIFGGKDPARFRFMDSFIEAVKTGKPYTLTEPYGTRDWMHVDRICEGIESLVNDRDHRQHHFGSGVTRKFIDVLKLAKEVTGKPLDNIKISKAYNCTVWQGAKPPFFKDSFVNDFTKETKGGSS